MKPKELQEKLGITADRIKFYKKQGLFSPERPASGNRATNYTENDYEAIKVLETLTKSGFTCNDIRKMQEQELSLVEAAQARINDINADMDKKQNALHMLSLMIRDGAEFETLDSDHYWQVIHGEENDGNEFIDILESFREQWENALKIDELFTDEDLDQNMVDLVDSSCGAIKKCLLRNVSVTERIGGTFKTNANISIIGKDITVIDPKRFMSILKKANNYDIYNRTDDTIYMSIGYWEMLKIHDPLAITERIRDQIDLTEEEIDELSLDQKIRYADIVLEKYNEGSEGFYKRTFDLDDERYIIQFAMSTVYDLGLDFLTLIGMCEKFVIRQTEETKQAGDGDVAEFEFTFRR